jgi:hypothetical protein
MSDNGAKFENGRIDIHDDDHIGWPRKNVNAVPEELILEN